jgi:hypothetical protein
MSFIELNYGSPASEARLLFESCLDLATKRKFINFFQTQKKSNNT